MDETDYGSRDRRGYYRPKDPIEIAPFFRRPVSLRAVLAWLPGYFLPWNLFFVLSALAWWVWIVPERAVMQVLSPGWVLKLLAVNAGAVLLFYGAFEQRLYVLRAQASRFKFNPNFPADRPNKTFLFGRQDRDNIARTFLSGVPIWTAFQVLVLWAWANDVGPWVALTERPVYLLLFALFIPVLHEFHFYWTHRMIHLGWLYRHVHSVHHKAVNPSPWSSLAMHPIEHLVYFSTALIHLIVASHPFLMIYQMHVAGFGAIVGHVGFDRMELGQSRSIAMPAHTHDLHHKYFEVNYGAGLVAFDKLFGTWHDGTEAADQAMRERLRQARTAKT